MRFWKVAGAAVATALLLPSVVLFVALRHGVAALPFGPALAAGAISLLTPADPVQPASSPTVQRDPAVVRGVASGDVGPTSAVVWAQTIGPTEVRVDVREARASIPEALLTASTTTVAHLDHAVSIRFEGLAPDTVYVYRVDARRGADSPLAFDGTGSEGRIRTAPDPSTRRDTSFAFSGDLGGGGYCRHPNSGYPIFDAMRGLQPDFFVAMGDMIYADNTCPATSPAAEQNLQAGAPSVASRTVDWSNYEQVRDLYFQHWGYNRTDERFQAFLREVPMYVLWDDHEIVNDGGTAWSHHTVANADRAGYPTLATAARDAFIAYAPLARDPSAPSRMYRRVRWGADLEFFLLDTRSYRSRNDLADTSENQKTMLGREQLEWLKSGLTQSSATWKVVATSVPLSIPSGGLLAPLYGRDAWANGTSWDYSSQTGFERELLDLLRTLDDARVQNLVFLSGDAHQAAEIRYTIDLNADGRPLEFHEIVAGPLSAPPFRAEPRLDPTLNPTMLYNESGFFNFGYVSVARAADGLSHFIADIRALDGQPRPGSRLDLTPAR